jgi:CHAT domain-containing protein
MYQQEFGSAICVDRFKKHSILNPVGGVMPSKQKDLARLEFLYRPASELYQAGKFNEAIPIVREALELAEKTLGPDHLETAGVLNSLAELYRLTGDYAKAEPLYQRALNICENVHGPDHPTTAVYLTNLAELYRGIADYSKAGPLFRRAIEIYEKALGADHSDADPQEIVKMRKNCAICMNNLALLLMAMNHYAEAETIFAGALKIREKVLGLHHPDTAQALSNLGVLYYSMGAYAKAKPFYERALKINEKALGPDHPNTAAVLYCLAVLFHSKGAYAKAGPLLERALKINEKALGPDHPDTTVLYSLAILKIDIGEVEDAISLARRKGQAEEKFLSDILSFTSEEQRLGFQSATNPYTLFATLASAPELAQTVLRQKGVVLDSLLEDRLVAEASTDPNQREVIAELRVKKQRLMQLLLEVPRDLSEAAQQLRAAEKDTLSTEVEQLEGGLARQVAGLGRARGALSVTVAQVQSVLPKQAVLLIELLRYSHYLGKGKFEDHYGAVVIPASEEPKWVPLGAAAEIEKDIKLYQKSVRPETDEASQGQLTESQAEALLGSVLKALEQRVWAPIEKALPKDTTTIIVSPDGELSFVSFATLLTPDDRFLGEKYSISYVASGRDLLRENKASSNSTTIVFANPDFERQATTQAAGSSSDDALQRSIEMRDLQSISLPALPGTAAEAAALEEQGGKAVKVFLGSEATEAELNRVSSPRVLHLATHGVFLPEVEFGKQTNPLLRSGESPKVVLQNPMYRSFLALTGAERTLRAWSGGKPPPMENDGVVTAEEVGGLKLNGTWLVVLSACETGSGEARAGEGVMGLRRGFVQAGAQNLLMTLWPVLDQFPVKILVSGDPAAGIEGFYAAADRTHNAPEALAEVQRSWLVKLRKQFGLTVAVGLAGPFIMSSQGKPP